MTTNILPGDFVAGLVEGEGCFILQYRREVKRSRPGSPAYFRWLVAFAVVLRSDDAPLLELVKNTLECGSISYTRSAARFQVQDVRTLLDKVVPFFDRFLLHGKKSKDFKLWKEAVKLIAHDRFQKLSSRSIENMRRLQEIRTEMRQYKSQQPPFKWSVRATKGEGSVVGYDVQ